MKYYIGLFIFLISTAAFSQLKKDSLLIKRDVLISKANQSGLSEIEKKEVVKIAFDIQNKGFLLVERKHEYLNGLTYIDNAVPIWQTLGNISMEANLYKLKGPLLGRLNRFDEGHEYINKALTLYKMIHQESGIAVTYFDLAQLYNLENKIDSAQYYVDLALNFWTREKDTSRIMGLNNFKIYILLKTNKTEQSQKLIEFVNSNFILLNVNEWDLMTYYFIQYKLNRKIHNKTLKRENYEKYKSLSQKFNTDLEKVYEL